MISEIKILKERIPFQYKINNEIALEFSYYIFELGSTSLSIPSNFYKYKLIDSIHGETIERIVLSDHKIVGINDFSYGIFPLYSRRRMLGDDNLNIYVPYVKDIFQKINGRLMKGVSTQESFIKQFIGRCEWSCENTELDDYQVAQINYKMASAKQFLLEYSCIMSNVGDMNVQKALDFYFYAADQEFDHYSDDERSIEAPTSSMYRTFEQNEFFNNEYNPFTNAIYRNNKVSDGIGISGYVRWASLADNEVYRPLFKIDDTVRFEFEKNLRMAFNSILYTLLSNNFMPSIVRVAGGMVSVEDDSYHSEGISDMPLEDICYSMEDDLEILSEFKVKNIRIMLTQNEDVFLTYTLNNELVKTYIDLTSWAMVCPTLITSITL